MKRRKKNIQQKKRTPPYFQQQSLTQGPAVGCVFFRREGFTSNTREEEVGCVGFLFHAFKRENEWVGKKLSPSERRRRTILGKIRCLRPAADEARKKQKQWAASDMQAGKGGIRAGVFWVNFKSIFKQNSRLYPELCYRDM